ncbi:MAG TPA: hypothetical protein VFR77_07195, partial [Steroidobacteraceae bacterium]|nr:hypothetical protein [Steroidobacteraceae bacterium]
MSGAPESPGRAIAAQQPAVLAASRFVAESLEREPGLLAALEGDGVLARPRAPGEIAAIAAAAADGTDEPSFMQALRRLRRHELVRIAWRDLAGAATLAETLAELSALA